MRVFSESEWWRGQDSNLRRAFARRVYSPLRLTAPPPLHGLPADLGESELDVLDRYLSEIVHVNGKIGRPLRADIGVEQALILDNVAILRSRTADIGASFAGPGLACPTAS